MQHRLFSAGTTLALMRRGSRVTRAVGHRFYTPGVEVSPIQTGGNIVAADPGIGSIHATEHAVISAFDLFSIGVGPSSSHTVGPMRAGKIFVGDLRAMNLLDKTKTIKITLHGSLAATGKGHMTPQAVMMGLEGSDPETIDPAIIDTRYNNIVQGKELFLGGDHRISYDMDKDMLWIVDPLPTHPNGMRFSVFDVNGDVLASNEYFSVGGGFIVNEETKTHENLYYREINKKEAEESRREMLNYSSAPDGSLIASSEEEQAAVEHKAPPHLFHNGETLLQMTRENNLSIAALVIENERTFYSKEEINNKTMEIWSVMNRSIKEGISSQEKVLPGGLGVRRRAPMLYKRLFTEDVPIEVNETERSSPDSETQSALGSEGIAQSSQGDENNSQNASATALAPGTKRILNTSHHTLIDLLSCYAIAVNEVNASGGRVVTAPTNGASGVIPAVLKYVVEFLSHDAEKDIETFLLTAAAVGMLYKRGATISAAEGGCMAEVGVACSMAAAGFAACMGGTPSQILQAAEIGIEHSLGLTCDPLGGMVQIPCIERNSLGAVKAVTAAQLALAGDGEHSVSLDEAIHAMKMTARDMHTHYKETSMSGLAVAVKIPVSSPFC